MIDWFTRHPTAANLLMAAIVILGLVSIPQLQRETFPAIKSDKVEVRVAYPGASSEEVEESICRRLETALKELVDLEELRCESREGIAIATVLMREGRDVRQFLGDIKSEVDAIDDFPELAEESIVQELGRTDAVVSIALTGPEDPLALKRYAESIESRLSRLPEIAGVELKGFSTEQFLVQISVAQLRRLGLSIEDLSRAAERQSVQQPVGELSGDQGEFLLRFDGRAESIEALSSIVVVSTANGAALRLGEIARIEERFENEEVQVRFNGKRAAILSVSKTRDQDTLDAFDAVAAFVDAEQQTAPPGVSLSLTQDRSSVVRDRLNLLLTNGAQGLAAVFVVLWLFFGWRFSIWVTLGLPVAFLGALFILPMVDISINMISMIGLLIGIGLLMDDAIVIAENIGARRAAGESPIDATANGVREVVPGVLSSFATTLLVFGSLGFIAGELGQVLRVMPIVLILVIAVSLIEAFFILPHHLAHSLRHSPSSKDSAPSQFERGFDFVRSKCFGPLVDRCIQYRYATLGLFALAIALAVAAPAGGFLQFSGFPDLEGDVLEARVLLPQGTPLSRTQAVVDTIERHASEVGAALATQSEQAAALVKNTTVIFGENPDAFESGPHVARVVIDLLGSEQRRVSLDEFKNQWRERVGSLPDVISINFTEPAVGPGGRSIDIRVSGDDLSELRSASLELRQWLEDFVGVTYLADDLRPGKPEFKLSVKDSAGALGIDADHIARQLRAAFQGYVIATFPRGSDDVEITVQLDDRSRRDIQALQELSIVVGEGSLVPLAVVADIEPTRGWSRIHRIDSQRVVTIQGDVDASIGNAQSILQRTEAEFFPILEQRYPSVSIAIKGQNNETAQTSASIVRNAVLGMIGVYMLLALQFRAYLAPITVLAVVPTALLGVVVGHMLLGLDLSLPSIVGMASLFGVVVNDSILLVVFIRLRRQMGMLATKAAQEAARARFRPIVLTSITTIAGLLPLLAETSLQAQVLIPIATSIAFGLTTATLSALLLVPALYCVLDDWGVLEDPA